jgi:hypothetical protein
VNILPGHIASDGTRFVPKAIPSTPANRLSFIGQFKEGCDGSFDGLACEAYPTLEIDRTAPPACSIFKTGCLFLWKDDVEERKG